MSENDEGSEADEDKESDRVSLAAIYGLAPMPKAKGFGWKEDGSLQNYDLSIEKEAMQLPMSR